MTIEKDLLAAHDAWLGHLIQERVGLVVNAHALVRAQVYLDTSTLPELGQRFFSFLPALSGKSARDVQKAQRTRDDAALDAVIADVPAFLCGFLGWPRERLAGAPGGPELSSELIVRLENFGDDRLEPTHALLDAEGKPLVLVRVEAPGTDLDKSLPDQGRRWSASPEARFERLLGERDIPIGILCNGRVVRLVYAPRTETAGHLSFPVRVMIETAGREVLGAMKMLLGDCLLSGPASQRLPAILRESRRYQNEVSNELSEQVLSALGELLAGFQAARSLSGDVFLATELDEDPSHIYGGLLATLMRLVFLLYAEDQELLPASSLFTRGYSITGLYARLRDDDARYHDTMDQRYGAWSQVLSLFSMVYFGAKHGSFSLPARLGELFDPNAYPFLEGRPYRTLRGERERIEAPRVPDGVVFRVLHKLLYLGPERISYRTLDVEQIGSVYEAMMGYTLEAAAGPSLCVKPHHVVVNLAEILAKKAEDRVKALGEVDCKPSAGAALEIKKAKTVEELAQALSKSTSPRRPGILAPGSLYLQPTEERRRSGSHYTPRELTKPIVQKTLAPVLARLGEKPEGLLAEDILSLKVCDPAMGSGAFLVEACRQLGAALEEAWKQRPQDKPTIPPDETERKHAMRLVAQRCLYGVDKNPFAVALAKLSLWLVTLAKEHPFTFLDHALREGDSLVGLSVEQITSFHWDLEKAKKRGGLLLSADIRKAVKRAEALRQEIQGLAGSDDTKRKQDLLDQAENAVEAVRRIGDLIIEAFFSEEKDKAREQKLGDYSAGLVLDLGKLREPVFERGLNPFHWEIEFPEVFSRDNPGFDCFVGNPPFMGGHKVWPVLGEQYRDWLLLQSSGSTAKTDIVVHFLRRTFHGLRHRGTCGLIATNTIAQGDSRGAGLEWICGHGGQIYDAQRRFKWPGKVSVVVSVVHVIKGTYAGSPRLDGSDTEKITSYLFHSGSDAPPSTLKQNTGMQFRGSMIYGQGFLFDDHDESATPLDEMNRLIEKNPQNKERVFPFIGGEEVNSDPRHRPHRYVINFADMSLDEARRWPDLLKIVEEKVKPERKKLGGYSVAEGRNERWWLFGTYAASLHRRLQSMERILAISQVTPHLAFAFLPADMVYSHKLNIIVLDEFRGFASLQSRAHEIWARFFSGTAMDLLRYTPTDCFETFPFPLNWQTNPALEAAGKVYYEYRAALMVKNNQGLTATYNRFHDPDEEDPDILTLRDLHDAMDRAVLDAYGWTDLRPTCTFLLDYEDDETDEETAGKARKKKPWRYRWPDDVRDEVLARLLALNQERAAEEKAAEAKGEGGKGTKKKR